MGILFQKTSLEASLSVVKFWLISDYEIKQASPLCYVLFSSGMDALEPVQQAFKDFELNSSYEIDPTSLHRIMSCSPPGCMD